ncbi:Serine active site containing protein 1, partial [Halocaridina rubra]
IDALYTYCWPLDWLVASLDIPVRIIAVEYDADWQISNHKCPLEACGKKISEHAEILSKSLKLANVGSRPIIWISHSMGGLIVKHILMDDCKEDITNIQCLKASLQKEQLRSIREDHSYCTVPGPIVPEIPIEESDREILLPEMKTRQFHIQRGPHIFFRKSVFSECVVLAMPWCSSKFVYEKGDLPKKLKLLQDDQRCGKNLTEQTKGVVFFSVPHHGTPLASFVSKPVVEQLLNPSVEVCEMSEDSPVLKETQAFFSNMVNTHGTSVLTLNESRPIHHDFLGLNIYFVPSKNADPKVGKFYEVDASHLDICKPMSRESDIYKKVSEFVQEVIKNL